MIGSVIRNFSRLVYSHPVVNQDIAGNGPFGRLKIAVLADYYTSISLAAECRIRLLSPQNYRSVLLSWRPDLVFVESAFHGVGDEWRYKLGKQPRYLKFLPGNEIGKLVEIAEDRGIPAVFWNKDDKAFFDFFLDVAKNFNFVFTTDSDCLPNYKKELPSHCKVNLLAMPYEPAFHNFSGFSFQSREACFVGSYYRKILKKRRTFLDMIFGACVATDLPINIYDRNSSRFSHFFEFRFPEDKNLRICQGVPYPATADLYKYYTVSINVNSITDSPTMISRRFLEILACGGICVTNANPAIRREFKDFCHPVANIEECLEILSRLAHGPSIQDLEKAAAGAAYVARLHTWKCRLEELADIVNF